ncbi:hypothetical protein JOB18_010739 [Solea senegalensis]|uniref:Uncharacterized protein n=1 Tax=Solea senegalensis TaxID=28829 RepID=A0AAV6T524_SOLSE|nr:hypothetical protein JOB18_010739 [Solea senegalensis]
MDQSSPNHQQRGAPQRAVPAGAFRQGNAPTVERGIISGDNIQFRRLRRSTRSESSGAEEEWLSSSMEANKSYGQSPSHKVDGVWYNRSSYEQVEGNYQRRLASNNNGSLSSSPRSPNTRGSLTFHSRRANTQLQDHGHPVTTVKASGIPHRQSSRGRNRTSSETEQGRKGSRGPFPRKRGFSETENRPRRDNTNMSGLQCLATESVWFDKHHYDEAEKRFYEGVNGPSTPQQQVKTALHQAKGRQQKRQHRNSSSHAGGDQELVSRMKSLELENQTLHKVVEGMRAALLKLESRVAVLEKNPATAAVPCVKVDNQEFVFFCLHKAHTV